MFNTPSRRNVLKNCCVVGTILITGCSALQSDTPDKIPILVENRDDSKREIVIEILDSENDFSDSVRVDSHETVTVTEVSGDFCLRAFIPSMDNAKDVVCPAPDEDDYSKKGYTIVIYPEDNPGSHSEIVHIVPNNGQNRTQFSPTS